MSDFEFVEGYENVVSIEDNNIQVVNHPQRTFTTNELFNALESHWVGHAFPKDQKDAWLYEGVKCRLLKPGEGWVTGRFRLVAGIEFCPDSPEQNEALPSEKLEELESDNSSHEETNEL
jgi:hypothetical protein